MNVKMDDEQFDDLAIEYDMTSSPTRKAKLKQRLITILDKDPEMLCATKALIFDPDFKVYENQMKLNILADCDDFDLEMAENRIDKDDKTQKDTIQNRINGDGYEAGQCDGDLFQKIKEWDGKIMTGVKTAIIVSAMYLGIAGVPGVKDTNLSLLENIAVSESYAGEASKPVVQSGYHGLPSTNGYTFAGQYDEDRSDRIPGKETLLKGYQKGDIVFVQAFYKGKKYPWSFWYVNTKTGQTFNTRTDVNNDRNYETYVARGLSNVDVDHKKWGLK